MATFHDVQQGEYLSLIARKYGFSDYRIIWDHGRNAELKQRRKDPNVLYPGDRLFIPGKEEKVLPCQTGQRHRFRFGEKRPVLRLLIKALDGHALSQTECELEVEGDARHVQTDAGGVAERDLPAGAQRGALTVAGITLPLHIGHLDPVDEPSGVQARLINLGYYVGPPDPIDQAELRSAIEEFQCDQGLPVTGADDQRTKDKLREIHGC